MATSHKTRIRQAPEPGNVIYGVRAAGRKYNIDHKVISLWIKNGEVALAGPCEPGAPLPIDEASLRKRIASYTPHRDNQARRRRSRTIPEMLAERESRAATAPALPRSGVEVVLLNSKEWTSRFYSERARASGGEPNHATALNYTATIGRFAERFPTLPMDRKTIIEYLHSLHNKNDGQPLSDRWDQAEPSQGDQHLLPLAEA